MNIVLIVFLRHWFINTTSFFATLSSGTTIDSNNPKEKMIFISLYVAIGLSVFAMCFKLMQEEVVDKVKWFAKKIGFIKSKEKAEKSLSWWRSVPSRYRRQYLRQQTTLYRPLLTTTYIGHFDMFQKIIAKLGFMNSNCHWCLIERIHTYIRSKSPAGSDYTVRNKDKFWRI